MYSDDWEEVVSNIMRVKDKGMLGFHPKNKPPEPPKPQKWMSPTNRIVFYRAFKKKLPQVKISDGRVFNCDYEKRAGYVWVSPASKELTPSGWFDLKRVTNPLWIEEV